MDFLSRINARSVSCHAVSNINIPEYGSAYADNLVFSSQRVILFYKSTVTARVEVHFKLRFLWPQMREYVSPEKQRHRKEEYIPGHPSCNGHGVWAE